MGASAIVKIKPYWRNPEFPPKMRRKDSMNSFELPLLTKFHLLRFAAVFLLGLGAQWLAWRFRIPSLLLLIIIGFIAGPVTHYLEPDVLLGELLTPVIAISVGLILFQSSLELQLLELRKSSRALLRLILLGAPLGFCGSALAAHYILGVTPSVAALIGAISITSGPTVIIPLLRETPLKGSLGTIVRWEGSALEVLGSVIALLAFQATYSLAENGTLSIWPLLLTLIVGTVLGGASAFGVLSVIRSMQIPDSLKGGISVGIILLGFSASYIFIPESGILTAVVIGLVLGNQRIVSFQRYLEFGEVLRAPLYSAFFIILAARLSIDGLREFSFAGVMFVAALILVVRPLAVVLSTVGTEITFREKLFIGLFAPRGAVAAAVASLFALNLLDIGYTDAERIVPITFILIILSVSIYGIGAPLVARALKLAEDTPRGVLLLGAHDWAREIAAALMKAGLRVLVVDSNHYNILAARKEGIPARGENIFIDRSLDEVVLDGIKHFLAMTSNDEVNTLASLHFAELFGPGEVYQLSSNIQSPTELPSRTKRYRNQLLFSPEATYDFLEERYHSGWRVKNLSAEEFLSSGEFLLLFVIMKNGQLVPVTTDIKLSPPPGSSVIALVPATYSGPAEGEGTVIRFEPRR
jgi:NhaP-type Na+/H+ or K+/H+ antiporter